MSNNTKPPVTSVKFHSLPLGERFSWRGAQYVKISPLIAREEVSGKSQLIQRAALVEPLDALASARVAETANAGQTTLEEYHQTVLNCLDGLAQTAPPQATAQAIAQMRQRLDEAHRRALKKLSTKN